MSKSVVGNEVMSRKMKRLRSKKKVSNKMLQKDWALGVSKKCRTQPYVRAHQDKIFWNNRCYGD